MNPVNSPALYKWVPVTLLGKNIIVMSRTVHKTVSHAIMYVHPLHIKHAAYSKYNEIILRSFDIEDMPEKINERLTICRVEHGMLQKDVAKYLGIHRSTYNFYEVHDQEYYDIEMLLKLAEFYKLPYDTFFDDYHQFLYRGQAEQIRLIRKQLNMTRIQFSKYFGIPIARITHWESNERRITRVDYQTLVTKTVALSDD